MAIVIHGPAEIAGMRRAGRVAAATLEHVAARVEPGVSTAMIDAWVREDTERRGAKPSQLGFHGFPAAVCTSPNEVVCHGIPRPDCVLKAGDILNIDVTSEFEGFHGDCSRTILIGEVSPEAERLVEATRRCRDAGIAAVHDGVRLGDIGAAIEELATSLGYGVVRAFGGHGIGRKMHMEPHVPHFGVRGRGRRLKAGMTITIEPMLTIGSPDVEVLSDGWTVVTRDRSFSAQFEHTVLVTRDGHEILTQLD